MTTKRELKRDPEPTLRLISLGAGVQSTTMLLLSAMGDLPKVDGAIFADTGWEPDGVYKHLDRLEEEVAKPAGIPIHRVSYGDLAEDLLDPNRMAMIPAYTLAPERTVREVAAWRPCSCDWARFRQLPEVDFEALAALPDNGLATVDFDVFSLLPARASRAEVEALAAAEWAEAAARLAAGEWPDEVLGLEESAEDLNGLASSMRLRGIEMLPEPHSACMSQGRIPTAWHEYTVRDKGMQGRKCTQTYKLRPLMERVRLLLGAPAIESPCTHCDATGTRVAPWRAKRGETVSGSCSVCHGAGKILRVGQPPAGRWAEQWIGFSTDEAGRISDRGDTRYSKSRHPLIDLNMSREQCQAFLKRHGLEAEKSACVGCPYHGNAEWRRKRDHDPASWKQAIAFDEAYRRGPGMAGERFLHISCRPLAEAPIDYVRPGERHQLDVTDLAYEERLEGGDPDGCSPWGCRSGEAGTP